MPVIGQLEEFASMTEQLAIMHPPIHRAGKKMHTRLRGNIRPILRAPVHVVVVVHLVELGAVFPRALNRGVDVTIPHERLADLGIGIRLRGAGHDPRVLEELICIQHGEELEGLFKVIDHLLRRHVVGVALGVEGADTGAVLAPLVFPERLVLTLIVFPVYGHVVEEVVAVEVLEDLGDVLVLSGFVAELLVGSIAFIGPAKRQL